MVASGSQSRGKFKPVIFFAPEQQDVYSSALINNSAPLGAACNEPAKAHRAPLERGPN